MKNLNKIAPAARSSTNTKMSCFLPPGRGLPSREAQVLKDLILLAWMFARIFAEICAMAYGPAPHADAIRFISRVPKRGSRNFERLESVESISGTHFFRHFFDF